MGEPAERSQAVVDRHDDYASTPSKVRPVERSGRGVAVACGPAVEPHKDRGFAAEVGRPRVQIEAVLACDGERLVEPGLVPSELLQTRVPGCGRVAHARPRSDRRGGTQTASAGGWRRVGDTQELRDTVVGRTFDPTVGRVDDRSIHGAIPPGLNPT